MAKQKSFLNSTITGVIPGLIIPLITIYFYYLLNEFHEVQTFKGFLNYVIKHGVISKVLSVCLIANLAVFFLFIWTQNYRSARGVMLATIIYVVISLAFMLFL